MGPKHLWGKGENHGKTLVLTKNLGEILENEARSWGNLGK